MSKKTKDIIFYCLAGVLALAMGIAAVLEAVKGEGNLVVSIMAAVAAIGLLILSGIEVYSIVKTKDVAHDSVEAKPVTKEVKPADDVVVAPAKTATKKAPAKKSTTKKSSK